MNHETCLSHDNEQQKLSRLFDKLSCAIQEILGGNLVGIYLHGSIAQKAFRWNVSDVDFLIVVQSEPSVEAKRQLLDNDQEIDIGDIPTEGILRDGAMEIDADEISAENLLYGA